MMNDANDTLRFGPQPEWRTGCEPSRGLDVENIEMKIGEPMTTPTPDALTKLNTRDYRDALEGRGPMASQWADKPHRLVFDLCSEIERITGLVPRASTNPDWHTEYLNASADAASMAAQVNRLREALRPFAVMADQVDEWQKGTNPKTEMRAMSETPNDFVSVVMHLTNFIQNERVAAFNEGVDMILNSTREWMRLQGMTPNGDNIPDLLDEIRRGQHADNQEIMRINNALRETLLEVRQFLNCTSRHAMTDTIVEKIDAVVR